MKYRLISGILLLASSAAGQLLPAWATGNWWKHEDVIQRLNLTSEQRKRIDDVFQQYRVRLIDCTAAVEREEVILEQLMNVEPPDPAKLRPQIEKVADARAQLEKTNSGMLLDMRLLLTREQWDALRERSGRGGPIPKKIPR